MYIYKYIEFRPNSLSKKQLYPFSYSPPAQIATHIHPSHTRSAEGMTTGNHSMSNRIRQTNGTHRFLRIGAGNVLKGD